MTATPPYTIAHPTFGFPELATFAGRAALGGAREVALAAFMIARLADGARSPAELPVAARTARAAAARGWLASLALPAASRVPFARAADASATGDLAALAAALRGVLAAVEQRLDAAAAAELRDLAVAIDRAATGRLAAAPETTPAQRPAAQAGIVAAS